MERRNEHRNITPFKAVHPGEILRMELKERGITQKALAKAIGMQSTHMSDLIHGRRNISADLAVRLEDALGIPAVNWMSLQSGYELDCIAIARRDSNTSYPKISRLVPSNKPISVQASTISH